MAGLLGVVIGGGCPDPVQPRLSDIQAKILTPNCSTSKCHSTETREAQLDLSAGHAYASLVGVAGENEGAKERGLLRVKPGDPDASLLVLKLGEKVDTELGVRMPWQGDALDADDVAAIAEWIRLGAKDD